MKYRELIKIPDFLTLTNLIFGVLSIFFSISQKFDVAAILIVIAVVFDYLDGKVARKIKREGEFGKELDSLCDVVSFGVAPAVFVYEQYGQLPNLYFILPILTFFILAGVLRLAKYNITKMDGYYSGLPITNAGWIIPLWYFLNLPYIIFLVLALGVLFVSPIKIKKVI